VTASAWAPLPKKPAAPAEKSRETWNWQAQPAALEYETEFTKQSTWERQRMTDSGLRCPDPG